MKQLIAFAGFAGTGKDEAAKPLMEIGYSRCCFGDIIKRQIDPLILEHLGFSAFTYDRAQKAQIRRTLESWGEDNYDNIMAEYFDSLRPPAVNTRLVRVREATEWVKRGGVIVEIHRPGKGPATAWEGDRFQELVKAGLIYSTISNTGSLADLRAEILSLAQ